jgi:hypothetical protein
MLTGPATRRNEFAQPLLVRPCGGRVAGVEGGASGVRSGSLCVGDSGLRRGRWWIVRRRLREFFRPCPLAAAGRRDHRDPTTIS